MMDQATRSAWLSLVSDKRSALTKLCNRSAVVRDEDQFKVAFEVLCDVYNQPRAQPLLRGLFRLFRRITVFSRGIDSVGNLSLPDNLTSVFWSYAYVLIKKALEHRIQLTTLVTTLQAYTKKVPKFGTGLGQHSSIANVQTPLQRFYSEYIDCYVMMITRLVTSPAARYLDSIKSSLDTLVTDFTKAKDEWRAALTAIKTTLRISILDFFAWRCWSAVDMIVLASRVSALCAQAISTSNVHGGGNCVEIEILFNIALSGFKSALSNALLAIALKNTNLPPKMSRGKHRRPRVWNGTSI